MGDARAAPEPTEASPLVSEDPEEALFEAALRRLAEDPRAGDAGPDPPGPSAPP